MELSNTITKAMGPSEPQNKPWAVLLFTNSEVPLQLL